MVYYRLKQFHLQGPTCCLNEKSIEDVKKQLDQPVINRHQRSN